MLRKILQCFAFLLTYGVSLGYALGEDQPLDLDFTQAPVSSILQSIATLADKNLVLGGGVTGSMSLHVNHMNWPEALNLVLQTQDLSVKELGNTWYINPSIELQNQLKNQIQVAQQQAHLAPITTDFLRIHDANAKDLAQILLLDKALIGERGQIVVDPRTNTLIISATAERLTEIQNLIHHLDIPVEEIQIDARIVEVDKSALAALGVVLGTSEDNAVSTVGAISTAQINLPIPHPAGVIGLGIAHLSGTVLNLELQALEASGDGKIISAPHLTVSDNQAAYIEQGSEIPFQTSTSSGATQIEFKKAVLGLKVVPHLSETNHIHLILQVNKDSIAHQMGPTGTLPIIHTSQVSTEVMVDSGETIILGGIYGEEQVHETTGVPVLSGIPGIGWLFRNQHDANKYTDLLIFVTPTLVAPFSPQQTDLYSMS